SAATAHAGSIERTPASAGREARRRRNLRRFIAVVGGEYMPEPIVIAPTLAASLSLVIAAGPARAPAADAAADTGAIVEPVVRLRLAFRGQSPSSSSLVIVADPGRRGPPAVREDGEEELPDEYALPSLIRTAELDAATTNEMRRALICDNAEPILPS